MNVRYLATLTMITAFSSTAVPVLGQAWTATAENYSVPRTPDGRPDLQGTWANNSATPMERPEQFAGKEQLTDEELAELQSVIAGFRDSEQAGDLLGDRLVQQALGNSEFADFDVITGNYNAFWLVEREIDNRTSLVMDPPNGRIPPVTREAQERSASRRAYLAEHPADGPEDRGDGDRCRNFGLPKIGSGYNSYHQILQTPTHVAVLSEMAHDARIIPIDGRPHLGADVRQLNGDARGHWEGDTLVVETTNFSPESSFRGSREGLHLVERFTRVGPETLEHAVTITDPSTWTQPWTVVLLLKQTQDAIFEYACHEGNYALPGILAGARAEEAAQTAGR